MIKDDLIKGYRIVEEIATGGSDRRFFRCRRNKQTYILILDKDLKTYLALQRHLYERGIGVPKVYKINPRTNLVLVEDLGTRSLYALARNKKQDIYRLYKPVLEELVKLQIDGFWQVPINQYYDLDHVRWEQEYFCEFFLHQFCRIPRYRLKSLKPDFLELGNQLMDQITASGRYLMHRDYQSQNIYLKEGRVRIIDFQSARIGPLTYDLASLLRDAYVPIPTRIEARLINLYLAFLKKRGVTPERRGFLQSYRLTGLQRNMQALGAFANLSLNKNKPDFGDHIPRGLAMLRSGLRRSNLENLCRVVDEIVV